MHQFLIFIVDDDSVFSNILSLKLEQQGYSNLQFFTSGEDCILSLNSNPDFIFLDYNLEGINGLETLKEIRKHNRSVDIFIATSSYDEKVKKECLKHGARLFMNKNSLIQGFPSEIKEIMEKKHQL